MTLSKLIEKIKYKIHTATVASLGESIQRLIQLDPQTKISADLLIKELALRPLSEVTDEGGFFIEFLKNLEPSQTEIYYLMKEKQISCWHSLDTNETWEWVGGCDVLIFTLSENGVKEIVLNKKNPLFTIKAGTLFGAKNNITKNSDDFGLVICACKPGFIPDYYKNPSPQELKKLNEFYKQYLSLEIEWKRKAAIIKELMPDKILVNFERSLSETLSKKRIMQGSSTLFSEKKLTLHTQSNGQSGITPTNT